MVRIDPAIVPAILGTDPYGVVISSDEMLARTHTLLFCPLIEGLDSGGTPTTMEPWHVEVQVEVRANQLPPAFKSPRLSTKVVFAAMPGELDKDRREHGRLDAKSRARAAELLKKWLPLRAASL